MNIDRKQLFQGAKAGLPIFFGYFPIAIAFGALAVQAGLTWSEAGLMSAAVFAGASQFVSLSMLLTGAGVIQIITATFFLNLRHLIMSLAVNNLFRSFSQGWKNFLSFFITDETFALLTLGDPAGKHSRSLNPFFAGGLMITAYSGWVSGTLVGSLGAEFIPPSITTAMTVGLYGLFIGLLVPPARKSRIFTGIALGAMLLNTIFNLFLSSGWAIVCATVLAAGGGVIFLEDQP